MRLVPHAVDHLRTYAVVALDATTLRILYEECTGWMAHHDAVTAIVPPGDKPEWLEVFSADVGDVRAAMDKIEIEMKTRGLELARGVTKTHA